MANGADPWWSSEIVKAAPIAWVVGGIQWVWGYLQAVKMGKLVPPVVAELKERLAVTENDVKHKDETIKRLEKRIEDLESKLPAE